MANDSGRWFIWLSISNSRLHDETQLKRSTWRRSSPAFSINFSNYKVSRLIHAAQTFKNDLSHNLLSDSHASVVCEDWFAREDVRTEVEQRKHFWGFIVSDECETESGQHHARVCSSLNVNYTIASVHFHSPIAKKDPTEPCFIECESIPPQIMRKYMIFFPFWSRD